MIQSIFLMAGGAQGSDPLSGFLPIILIGVVFYFFMIRPQMKKAKQQKVFLAEIKKGDKVITSGGIMASISEIKDDYFVLEVEGGNKLKVVKTAVSVEASAKLNEDKKDKK